MIDFNFKTIGNKQNKPILMLHGYMGESTDWESLSKKLEQSYYCIAIDLPGHGLTIATDETDYTIEKTSEAIIEFLKKQNINKTHLLGYSMGGRIAFHLLTHYPTYFDKALIESSSPGLKTEEEKTERIQKDLLLSKRMHIQPLELFLEDWYNLGLFASINKNSDKFREMIKRKTKNDIAKLSLSLKYSGIGVMASLWESLDKIQTEVLCVTGALDKKYCSIAREISEKHSNFSHLIIDDVSHNVHFENEDKYCETIKEFLK